MPIVRSNKMLVFLFFELMDFFVSLQDLMLKSDASSQKIVVEHVCKIKQSAETASLLRIGSQPSCER